MIDWFRAWSRSIVTAVIIATVIEMVLPNNNSKKYIKIVIGIFVVYTIISPMVEHFSGINIDEINNLDKYVEASSSNIEVNETFESKTDSSIRAIYSQNLQNDVKNKLKNKGYIAGNVKVEIANDDSYNIERIDISIDEKTEAAKNEKQAQSIVDTIKYVIVKIDNPANDNAVIDENDKNGIRQMIRETYGVEDSNINVN